MGNCVSTIKGKKEPHKAITLAIIGLDNAGKTTLCYVLSGEQLDPDIAPTVGFRNVKFSHSSFDVTVFDLGGGENIRPIWKTYFGEVFGLMYVIDSSSPSRLIEARDIFKNTLEHPQVSGKPVLILANKVDKEEHMKDTDIINALQLNTINASTCPSKLVMVSALRGVGTKMDKEIQKGLQWLFEKIRSSLTSLEPRIQEDMKTAKEAREKEREERKARVKKQREEREKAEELERTQLGLSKKEDSDEDDIILGDPFKALDIEKLKKKEQQLREEKLLKQERIKELASKDEGGQGDEDNNKNLKIKGTKQDMAMSLSDGLTLHLDEVDTSSMTLLARKTQASALPPLERIEYQNNLAASADRKKRRKKKKLTDYHLPHDNDLNLPHKDDATVVRALSPHVNVLSNSTKNILGQTPVIDKPKKFKDINAEEVDESEQEYSPHRDSEAKHENRVIDIDRHNFTKDMTNGVSSPIPENKVKNQMKDSDTVSNNSKDSKSRKSLKKMKLSDVNVLDAGADGDGFVDSNKNILEHQVVELQNIQHLNDKTSIKSDSGKRKNNSLTNLLSDEENNSYESHSILKDTLRFPLSPGYVDDLRKSHKEMNHRQKYRNPDVDSFDHQQRTYEGIENGGFTGFKSNTNSGGDHNDLDKLKTSPSHSGQPSNRDEETAHMSEKSDTRRKKKRNFLRSNKIAPLDENLKPVSKEMPDSTHAIPVHESRHESALAETPTKNRNTTVTSRQGNTTLDSDFNMNWGLAEDLPAIDSNNKVYRMPNFDTDDDDDIVV